MFYYLVGVRSNRYHGSDALTYSSEKKILTGTIVAVELQNTSVLAIVFSSTTKPKFKTKVIIDILDLPPLPGHSLKLLSWMQDFYPAPLGLITQQFLPPAISIKNIDKLEEKKTNQLNTDLLPPLNAEQSKAFNNMSDNNTYILHGKTGTGKTRIYLEMAAQKIRENKSVVVLTPEISLTSQLAQSFSDVFGTRVIVIHSRQSPKQRQEAWLKCLLSTEPLILIGPRSALFAPLNKLGLIVIDESHEGAYKQTQSPQYQTTRVASYLSKITQSTLILGSATPLVTDYFIAKAKNKPILELHKLAVKSNFDKKDITIVDRKDNNSFSQSPYLSKELIEIIAKSLRNKEQTLLYLNRRGTARLVLCENCGWQAICPHCYIPLTYHSDKHQLRCHSCNYSSSPPTNCPECGYSSVVFKTAGTKAIMQDVVKIFPHARISRFDTDNLKADSFEQNYLAAKNGDIDILIGTQILAKGLDLPRLSTVGILLADTSLYIPDYTAQERTFQLINQVLGRIGRGHVAGHAVIQTYHPDHPIIKFAIEEDYSGFYDNEIKSRKQFLFPPYCYLLKITTRRSSLSAVEKAMDNLKTDIINNNTKVKVEGPAPSFQERYQGKYQWQVVVKSTDRSRLVKIVRELPANFHSDIDPVDLL